MSMFETLSHLYSKAVSLTVGVAPADWTRLWIRGECEEASWSFGGYWERSETDEVIFFEVPYEAEKLTWESWRVSRSHNDSWSTILFRVDRPDKLTITFGREDLNDESYSSEESQAAFRADIRNSYNPIGHRYVGCYKSNGGKPESTPSRKKLLVPTECGRRTIKIAADSQIMVS